MINPLKSGCGQDKKVWELARELVVNKAFN
jgi:hypothetical protein